MDYLPVAWSYEDEISNWEKFNIDFKQARQVVLNASSLKVANIHKDFTFIGPVDDLTLILIVYCKKEEGFRKITWSKNASRNEKNAYFNFLARGGLR